MKYCWHALRQLAGLTLASALITLDGASATIALPAIARELSVPMSRLQWIANAPLLMLAALLLPSGTARCCATTSRVASAAWIKFMLPLRPATCSRTSPARFFTAS